MSLPRPVRMTQSRDFEAVRRRGSSVGSRLLALGVLEDPSATRPKCGVIVPKALGSAPLRNHLKRQLREIIRHALPAIESARPHPPVCVTIARRASVGATFDDLRREWHRLARRAGLSRPPTQPTLPTTPSPPDPPS